MENKSKEEDEVAEEDKIPPAVAEKVFTLVPSLSLPLLLPLTPRPPSSPLVRRGGPVLFPNFTLYPLFSSLPYPLSLYAQAYLVATDLLVLFSTHIAAKGAEEEEEEDEDEFYKVCLKKKPDEFQQAVVAYFADVMFSGFYLFILNLFKNFNYIFKFHSPHILF